MRGVFMKSRELLLLIKLSKGIGIHGDALIYDWLVQEQKCTEVEPSAEKLVQIARIKPPHKQQFIQDFNQNVNLLKLHQLQAQLFITILDADYPDQLREIYLPPIVLFYAGNGELLKSDWLLGVVGARKASHYSIETLRNIVRPAVSQGLTVVSGLAEGVDKLSHQCAISVGQPTIGVIGTGLDVFYPKTNEALQREMSEKQLVISEYPAGTSGARHHFPERNRIIAGLVQTLLVTEARHQSGSLITANLALQENRNVLAIPGDVTRLLSTGCNELIAAGAKPILSADDILEEFRF